MISPTKAYFEMLVDFCQANDVMLIFDEVIAFRLGYERPRRTRDADLTALGKIIGGGFLSVPLRGGAASWRSLKKVAVCRMVGPSMLIP